MKYLKWTDFVLLLINLLTKTEFNTKNNKIYNKCNSNNISNHNNKIINNFNYIQKV